jgi:hypothetical protein
MLVGWCTKSHSNVNIPNYDALTKKVVRYSSFQIPQTVASPQFVISDEDRSAVVLRGTLSDSAKHSHKTHGKFISAPIFCGKDVSALPDGNYVFRIGGALSKDHTHRDTRWELCGRHGTSDEELQFNVNKGVCQPIAKRTRWSIRQSWALVDISGSISLFSDSSAGLADFLLADASQSETILDDLESVIFLEASSIISSLNGISWTSIAFKDAVLQASFRIRMDASSYVANNTIAQDLMVAELQVKFNSDAAAKTIIRGLHEKPEFATVSKVLVSGFHYEGLVREQSLEGREFATSAEPDHTSMLDSTLLFYFLCAVVCISAVLLLLAARMRR